MKYNPRRSLSRRDFLATSGSIALGAAALGACGGSSPTSGTTSGGAVDQFVLVTRYPNTNLVPGRVRLPISLANISGGILTDDMARLPETLTARVVRDDSGEVVVDTVIATKHGAGLPQPYWPFIVEIDDIGIYVLQVEGGPTDGATFELLDPAFVSVPLVGESLPPFDTATISNTQGLDPICTYTAGTCPFHDITLTDALTSGKPVAYLIGTPAYCKTGTCAPALETLIDAHNTLRDDIVFVHSEVYTDRTATTVAPAVRAYFMDFEPALFITDAAGILRHRLDAIFDADELRDALAEV
jgi:hypothetical protein